MNGSASYFIFIFAILGLSSGLSWFVCGIFIDLKVLFDEIDSLYVNYTRKDIFIRSKATAILSDFLQLHNEMFRYSVISFPLTNAILNSNPKILFYRLMTKIEDLMSAILFFQLLMYVIFIALSLLAVYQAQINTSLLFDFECLGLYTAYTFLFCLSSENLTQNSMDVGNVAYNSTWYCMPINERKAIILIILRSQQEFRLDGLGMFECSFVTFSQVRFLVAVFTF